MFKKFLPAVLVVIVVVTPSFAQRRGRLPRIPDPIDSNASFMALFDPVVASASRSTVRVQVDGKDTALGTAVANGFVLTKASELKSGKISVKTRDGRDFDATQVVASDAFDLALLKIDGTGLVPVTLTSSNEAPAGDWIAVAGIGKEPTAVGVVGAGPRTVAPPYRGRLPLEKSGFLGITIQMGATRATIGAVSKDSAAEKAGLQTNDTITQVEENEIPDPETLINTLLTYKVGDKVKIKLERGGKAIDMVVTLGKRTPDLLRGGSRGDFQNAMGSKLSDRRNGIPRFFQTDAVIKPYDCGAPVVNLDGHVVGLIIARAGRTESHIIPAETVKELLPILMAANQSGTPDKRVDAAREALQKAEKAKALSAVVSEGRRLLGLALAEEKWWKTHPVEKAPTPHEVDNKRNATSRTANK